MAATAPALEERGRAIGETLVRARGRAELLRTPARAGVAVIERRSGELAAELQACAHDEAGVQATARTVDGDGHRDRGRAHPLHRPHRRARPPARPGDRRRRASRPSPDEPLPADERAAVAARLERLERRRESLGAVNPLAAEEYETEKRRAGELTEQCADLERSLRELRGLIRDLTQTIDRRFAETFERGRAQLHRGHPHAVPGRLGPAAADRRVVWARRRAGGRGRGGRRGAAARRTSPASSSR